MAEEAPPLDPSVARREAERQQTPISPPQTEIEDVQAPTTPRPNVAYYLFNFVKRDAANGPSPREQAAGFMRLGMWGVDASERHRNALATRDLVLIYLGAPEREFIGRAELGSAAHDWTPSEAEALGRDSAGGVLLTHVEQWDPPVPMSAVLAQIGPSENAKAEFEAGVVRITAGEYATALAVAAERATPAHAV